MSDDPVDLSGLASNIELRSNGIWYAKSQRAISYPETGNEAMFEVEQDSFWFRHRNACIVELMRGFPPPGRVFDIGGGNGVVARALAEAGFPTVLVEPGERGVLNAQHRGLPDLVCATLEDAAFGAGALPAAGLFDVIEHIEDDGGFLRKLRALVAPGGRIYITVPAYRWLWSDDDDIAGHFTRHTQRSVKHLIEGAGFELEFATYMFSVLPIPILLSRTLPSRLGLHRTPGGVATREPAATQHRQRGGPVGRLLDRVWRWELDRIRVRAPIRFGGSVLTVARASSVEWPRKTRS